MNNPNITDVTDSPEDWEFLHSLRYAWDTTSDDIVVNMDGGVGGSWKVNPKVSNYVDDVLSGKTSSANANHLL